MGVAGAFRSRRQELKAGSATLEKNLEFPLEGRGRELVAKAKDSEKGCVKKVGE